MEKKLVEKTALDLYFNRPVTWNDIKDFIFEDTDQIEIGYVEPWENGSDNSGGGHFQVVITRFRLETDEEFNERVAEYQQYKEESRKRRYETYLKLKKEFENEK